MQLERMDLNIPVVIAAPLYDLSQAILVLS